MKKVIAIQHVDFEDLGLLEPILVELGYEVQYAHACYDDLNVIDALAPDLVVILGGPIGVSDVDSYPFLQQELAIIKARLAQQRPLLGICLGAQLIAHALGARVSPMGGKEIGFAPLQISCADQSILAPLYNVPVLHWHGDQFALPDQTAVVHLAATEICACQGFSWGDWLLAFQFHLEADVSLIERWLVGHACELSLVQLDPAKIRADAQRFAAPLQAAGISVMRDWLHRLP